MNDFQNAARQKFLISQGDNVLAEQWLEHICLGLMTDFHLSVTDRKSLVVALMGFVNRGEADQFWNNGKKPNRRLKPKAEMIVWRLVTNLRDDGYSKAEALEIAAGRLGYQSCDSDDNETYLALDRVTNEYRSARRKLKKFLELEKGLTNELLKDNPYFQRFKLEVKDSV